MVFLLLDGSSTSACIAMMKQNVVPLKLTWSVQNEITDQYILTMTSYEFMFFVGYFRMTLDDTTEILLHGLIESHLCSVVHRFRNL